MFPNIFFDIILMFGNILLSLQSNKYISECIHDVRYPKAGDFLVDRKYLFEVGGKGKNFDQIKDIADSYLAVDNTEVGHRNRIPLWMFGLLY